MFLSVSLLNLFNGFRHLSNEGKEGPLDIILPFVLGALGVIICVTLLIRKRMDKKEQEEEIKEDDDIE